MLLGIWTSVLALCRRKLALYAGRLAGLFCRLVGREGTSLPGWVALRVYPELLRELAQGLDEIVIITGTNGKTTTSNLLARILREKSDAYVVHNAQGANMPAGVAAALVASASKLKSTARPKVAVLEVDEGSLQHILEQIPATLVVVTNILRDQLDRYHELEETVKHIRQSLSLVPQARLLLNADDPLVASLGWGREHVFYFGLERNPYVHLEAGDVREGHVCPRCRGLLEFAYYHYSHLGLYRCSQCGWLRPLPHFQARDLKERDEGFTFDLGYPEGEVRVFTLLPGIYNCYNVLVALGAGFLLGIHPREAADVVSVFRPGRGRIEKFGLRDKKVILALVKNPTGFSETLRALLPGRELRERVYLLAINDLAADGRDVSWLWDVDWGPLLEAPGRLIICSGLRAWDMAVCLKYQGIDLSQVRVIPDQGKSLEEALGEDTAEVLILCTYTNLAVYRRLLRRMGARSEAEDLPSLSRTA